MKTLNERLEKVGQSVPDAPDFAASVMRSLPSGLPPAVSQLRFPSWALATAGALAACVLVAVVLWPSSGQRLYAAAAQALEGVHTIHITGWTLRPERRHYVQGDSDIPVDRHTIDEWEWKAEDGTTRRLSIQGAVTIWDDGQRRYEHQTDRHRLFIDKSAGGPMSKFTSLMDRLEDLTRDGFKRTDLGERKGSAGGMLRGYRIEKAGERGQELWFDTKSRLPVQLSAFEWKDGQWAQVRESLVEYNLPVPDAVAQYSPPADVERHYAWGIDARFDAWHDRLKQLAARYKGKALPEPMELVPRDTGEPFEAYAFGKLPDITTHVVRPLGGIPPQTAMTIRDYLRRSWATRGTVRVPGELGSLELNHDLVLKVGTSEREEIQFVLKTLGLELVEVIEPREVWVAHYDGRPLKDWREVKAPIPNPDHRPADVGMAMSGGGSSLTDLFNGFMYYQDYDLTGDQILIVDETGLTAEGAEPKLVSDEDPYFAGPSARALAKQWFAEQFGVTFTEETRDQTIYLVRQQR